MKSPEPQFDAQQRKIAESYRILRSISELQPQAAIILGSGLGGLAKEVETEAKVPYSDLPGLPTPRASGHAGELILGRLGGLPVIVFAGRAHLYEGHNATTTVASIQLAAAMGAKLCIASNAAGGVNPRFQTGDLVAIDSHINHFYQGTRHGNVRFEELQAAGNTLRSSTALYDPGLISRSCDLARELGFTLHRGTYLGTLGPTYETRAEYRAFRTMGADMVGMSTILEMIAASQEGMQTLAFSVITNVANPDQPAKTTHDEVLDVAAVAQNRLLPLVVKLLSTLA